MLKYHLTIQNVGAGMGRHKMNRIPNISKQMRKSIVSRDMNPERHVDKLRSQYQEAISEALTICAKVYRKEATHEECVIAWDVVDDYEKSYFKAKEKVQRQEIERRECDL